MLVRANYFIFNIYNFIILNIMLYYRNVRKNIIVNNIPGN